MKRSDQERRARSKDSTVYEHRLNRRAKKVFTGSTDVTEPAAKKSYHRLIRRNGLNSVGSTGDSTPDDPTKSNPNAGAVVQRDLKMTQRTPVDPTIKRQKLNAPVYAKTLAPFDPTQ